MKTPEEFPDVDASKTPEVEASRTAPDFENSPPQLHPFEYLLPSSPELEAEINNVGRQTRRRLHGFVIDVMDARVLSLNRFASVIDQHAVRYVRSFSSLRDTESPDMNKDAVRQSRKEFTDWFLLHLAGHPEAIQPSSQKAFESISAIFEQPFVINKPDLILQQQPPRLQGQAGDSMVVRTAKFLKRTRSRFSKTTPLRRVRLDQLSVLLSADLVLGSLPIVRLLEKLTIENLIFVEKYISLLFERFNKLLGLLDKSGITRDTLQKFQAETLAALHDSTQRYSRDVTARVEELKTVAEIHFGDTFAQFVERSEKDGTIEFNSSGTLRKTQKRLARDQKNHEKHIVERRAYMGAFIDSIVADQYVVVLGHDVGKQLNSLLTNIRTVRKERIRGMSDTALARLESELDSIKTLLTAGIGPEARAEIVEQKENVTAALHGASASAESMLKEDIVETEINRFLLTLKDFVNDTRDVRYAIRDEDKTADKDITKSGFVDLPLKNIVSSFLTRKNPEQILAEFQKLKEEYSGYAQELIRFSEVIDFNTDLALSELAGMDPDHEKVREAKDLLIGAMERVRTQTSDLLSEVEQAESVFDAAIAEHIRTSLQRIRELVEEKDPVKIGLYLFHGSTTSRLRGFLDKSLEAIARGARITKIYAVRLYRFVLRKKETLSTRFGLEEFKKQAILDIKDRASVEKTITEKLPFIYRKLFKIEPLETTNFLIGRSEQYAVIRRAYERWKSTGESNLAIIGEVGSGKTSVINCADKTVLKDETIIRVNLDHTVTEEPEICRIISRSVDLPVLENFADMQAALNSGPPRIILVEDAENLYLRTVGGTSGLKDLLIMVSETYKNVLWIFTFRKYAWNYLDRTLRISSYFYYDVETRSLSKSDIRKVIMTRHDISGYKLSFEVSEGLKKQKAYRKARTEEERQSAAADRYFDKLLDISQGNIMLAMFYWLTSIERYESNVVFVGDLSELDFRFISQLPMDQIYTLAAMVQHSNLSIREHAQIFHNTPKQSMLAIEALETFGLVVKSNRFFGMHAPDEYYSINPVIYVETVKILRSKNVLY